mmetsp:Transcript_7687/g.8825  ORF Transcript_7687/g.8825 Transcript_7687/m.8825 type:complete len:204 (-) Transcript_7687:119-730(-)
MSFASSMSHFFPMSLPTMSHHNGKPLTRKQEQLSVKVIPDKKMIGSQTPAIREFILRVGLILLMMVRLKTRLLGEASSGLEGSFQSQMKKKHLMGPKKNQCQDDSNPSARTQVEDSLLTMYLTMTSLTIWIFLTMSQMVILRKTGNLDLCNSQSFVLRILSSHERSHERLRLLLVASDICWISCLSDSTSFWSSLFSICNVIL